MASQTSLTGVAGEHYVLYALLRQGYIAALAPPGVPNSDIVVTNRDGSRLCSIQVKTRSGLGTDRGWHMHAKHERELGDRHFYCFVDLQVSADHAPIVYVVPCAKVAEVVAVTHKKWLDTPGKMGQPYKPTQMRRFLPDYAARFPVDNPYPAGWLDIYRNRWDLLKLGTTDPNELIEQA